MAFQGNSSAVGDFNDTYSLYQAPAGDQTNSYMQYDDDGNDWDDDEEYPSATVDWTTLQPFDTNINTMNTSIGVSEKPLPFPLI